MNTRDDWSKKSGEAYRVWEKAMGAWWDKVLESPEVLKKVNENLKTQSQARRVYEDGIDTTMSNLHLPSRKDVVRVARIAGLLEEKILGVEDKLLAMEDRLERIEKETLRARIDAAEALLTVQDQLAATLARLDQLTALLEGREASDKTAPKRAPKA